MATHSSTESAAIDCNTLVTSGGVLVGDPDISGIGVILAFLLSAYMTFAAVLGAYLFGFVEEALLNPVDVMILRVRPFRNAQPSVHAALRKVVLAFSDQQVVTGIAIMGSGFHGLRTGNISVYHFQIVLYLAWMSSSVHLSALTLLRSYLHSHTAVMAWRLCGMLVLLALLLVGLVPTISNDWGIEWLDGMLPGRTGWGIPAICFWGRVYSGANADSILAFVILLVSYIWKVGGLFTATRQCYDRYVRRPWDRMFRRTLFYTARRYAAESNGRWLWLLMFRIAITAHLPMTAMFEFSASFSASLWLSALGLLVGTTQVVIPRTQNIVFTAAHEDTWAFGQLMPLILLALPLGAVTEVLWVRKDTKGSAVSVEEENHDNSNGGMVSTAEPRCIINSKRSLIEELNSLSQRDLRQPLTSEPSATVEARHRQCIQSFLYTSRLFSALVWYIQVVILAFSIVVSWADATIIGKTSSDEWYYILVTMAVLTTAPLFTFALLPLSRLGRSCDGSGGGATDEPERPDDIVFPKSAWVRGNKSQLEGNA